MRRTRRGGHGGMEFGGSGEDSFVAVVVTKLTGALLFILLLTMVIMALLPKAVDAPGTSQRSASQANPPTPLAVSTPSNLPEGIAGRPYSLAFAARGGTGAYTWSMTSGALPRGLTWNGAEGRIEGTPEVGTPEPVRLVVSVKDGEGRASLAASLLVFQPEGTLSTPSRWAARFPVIPWKSWIEQGFGFLVLWLTHLVAMSLIHSLERWSLAEATESDLDPEDESAGIRRRFVAYRWVARLASLAAFAALAAWMFKNSQS